MAIFGGAGKIGAGQVLGGKGADAQGADIVTPFQHLLVEDFRPGIDGIAGKERGNVAPGIDGGDMEGVGEAVERQRARQGDDMAAIDKAAAEAVGGLFILVEMNLGGVLVKAGGEHVLGLLDGHAIDMVDALAGGIVVPQVARTRRPGVVAAGVEQGNGVAKLDRLSRSVMDFAGIMETAKAERWSVVVLDLAVDTTTTNGELIANIMISLAQWERRLIGDRTRAALDAVKARGTKLGRRPNVDEDTVRLIRILRDSGRSWQAIADSLDREGIDTAQGGRWHGATVRKIHQRAVTEP